MPSLSFAAAVATAILSFSSPAAAWPVATVSSPGINPTSYKVSQVFKGNNFYDNFDFFTNKDPTGGLVKYLSLSEARAKNLTHADAGSFVIRGDATRTLAPGQGRDSVRIHSKRMYTSHVQVFDVAHMPQGKGTWPAYWMTGDEWPFNGEIDILEGANDAGPNLYSLHTGPDCAMPDQAARLMKGVIKPNANNCYAYANGNNGCGVFGDSKRDFGPALNQAGGGFYALERRADRISMWFWSRADATVPREVKEGAQAVDPSTWGRPTAEFSSTDACDLSAKFGPNRIVINLTFCGGFAGHTFPGGTDACNDFVANHPEEFGLAYWNIRSLTVYE